MKFEDVRHLVLRVMGDKYYKEFHELEEDMDFFNLYLQRNKKCDTFHYTIIPCENFVAFSAFIDIYKQYGYGYLEKTYTIFKALKLIVLDVYNETNKFTHDEIRNFVDYFKKELELDVVEYAYCFIGCSHGTAGTVAKIQSIVDRTTKTEVDTMTNREKLNQMSNEDFANIVELVNCFKNGYKCPGMNVPNNGCNCNCKEYFIKWLEQETEDDKP